MNVAVHEAALSSASVAAAAQAAEGASSRASVASAAQGLVACPAPQGLDAHTVDGSFDRAVLRLSTDALSGKRPAPRPCWRSSTEFCCSAMTLSKLGPDANSSVWNVVSIHCMILDHKYAQNVVYGYMAELVGNLMIKNI